MNYLEMKARRDELWVQLDDLTARKAPLDKEESNIRAEIKTIQSKLFKIEAKHSIARIEEHIELGKIPQHEMAEKLEKLAVLKSMVGE